MPKSRRNCSCSCRSSTATRTYAISSIVIIDTSSGQKGPPTRSLCFAHSLDHPKLVNFALHAVPVPQVYRRLHHRTDSPRRAAEHHVAGLEGHDLRQVCNLVEHVEDELPRIRLLPQFSIDPRPDAQPMRIPNLICRGDPRAKRPMCVE